MSKTYRPLLVLAVLAATCCGTLTLAQQAAPIRDDCRDQQIVAPTDAGPVDPIPPLTPRPELADLRVHLQFIQTYSDDPTDAWTTVEKQYECAAAMRFEKVWQSQQFMDRVIKLPWMVLREGENVQGPDLYKLLLQNHQIVMLVSIQTNGSGWAVSIPRGETRITHTHIDRANEGSDPRGTPLVLDLSDNLSHEYTHYQESGRSQDGRVQEDARYVSYGIGCMTENIASASDRCDFDPSLPNLGRYTWVFPSNATEHIKKAKKKRS